MFSGESGYKLTSPSAPCPAIFVFQPTTHLLRVRAHALGVCDILFMSSHRSSVMAGVGIFFQQESDGNVYIKTIVSGVKSHHA